MKKLLLLAVLVLSSQRVAAQAGPNNPYEPVQMITNGDMSQATLTSLPVNVMSYPNIGIQFVWTGSPVGVLGVKVSDSGIAGTYTPLTLTGLSPPANQPAGSAGSWWLDLRTFPQYIEITYAKTSGTGTLQAYVGAKK